MEGKTMIDTASMQSEIQHVIEGQVEGSSVPGFVAGIWWDGESCEAAAGTANLNTGAPMTADTAFLLGSISKVLVTSMLMRFVERGQVRLDDRVIDHLPDFRLGDGATAEALRVRNLVNHSSGIDAADYAPELGRGADAISRYMAALASVGQLYPLGRHISYCNPAFVIAGRLMEVLSGETFDTLIRREIFTPTGMERSVTSGDEAILHRAAVGHIVDPETNVPRATRRFMLPYSLAPAGSTIITTIPDLLRFARVHLDAGVTPEGERILSPESVEAMATESIREEEMGGFAVGLGWLLPAMGSTRVLMHTGGSYGGISSLIVVPEKHFACAAFGNSTTTAPIHQKLHDFVLQELLGMPAPAVIAPRTIEVDPSRYAGTYHKQHQTITIASGENGTLAATITLAYDRSHRELFLEYSGREQMPPFPLFPLTESFCVAGVAPTEPVPVNRMTTGITFLDPDENGRFRYLSTGLRIATRVN
jgi:CubicO group peptidase (beta-lactamase class C family)